jgi:hypothetical protein
MRSMKVTLLNANCKVSLVSNDSVTKNCCLSKTSIGSATRQPCATQASCKVLVGAFGLFCTCKKKCRFSMCAQARAQNWNNIVPPFHSIMRSRGKIMSVCLRAVKVVGFVVPISELTGLVLEPVMFGGWSNHPLWKIFIWHTKIPDDMQACYNRSHCGLAGIGICLVRHTNHHSSKFDRKLMFCNLLQ